MAKKKRPTITHWNYRVLQRTQDGESWFEIVEVYYGADGSMSYCPSSLIGDTTDDLATTLRQMVKVADLATLKSKKNRCLTEADFAAKEA